jgi:hypothetical protein
MKYGRLVEVMLSGDNIHRTLAEKVVESRMYSSNDWLNTLRSIDMNISLSAEVKELFLVRNCLVHNDRKVSAELHGHMPDKYKLRKNIHLSTTDYEYFRDHVHKIAVFMMAEYSRLFPVNTGTWLIR